MIHFLGFIISIAMLKLFIELPLSPWIDEWVHSTKLSQRLMSSNIFRLLFFFVMRLTLRYRLTTNKHQRWDPILCCCGYIKYKHRPWFEWFGRLYFAHYAWAGFGGGEAWEDKLRTYVLLLTCYTARDVIRAYCLYATHKYLTKFLKRLACKCQVKIELYCSIKFCKSVILSESKCLQKLWFHINSIQVATIWPLVSCGQTGHFSCAGRSVAQRKVEISGLAMQDYKTI